MAETEENRKSAQRPAYGRVRSPEALGRLVRQERRQQGLTLDEVYSASGLTTRFLSEFERGKPNASIGRVMDTLQALGLELLALPRGEAERLLSARSRGEAGRPSSTGRSR